MCVWIDVIILKLAAKVMYQEFLFVGKTFGNVVQCVVVGQYARNCILVKIWRIE